MILPTIRQIQTVADLLRTGAAPTCVVSEQLTEPWQTYHQWILDWIAEDPEHVDPHHLDDDFHQAFAALRTDFHTHYQLIRQAIREPVTYPHAADTLAGVAEIRWLWKGWLLRGLPSLLAAVPGTGKSYLALDLARRIITGDPFPDGQPAESSRDPKILYVDAENTPAIHKERLSVWPPAALHQLYIMLPEPDRFLINLDDHIDRDRLYDMAWAIRPALIIIDSYGSCTLKGENNKEDVQGLLAYFNQLAQDFDCALLIVHHLRKGIANNQSGFKLTTIDAIRGSSHIPAMSRHVLGLQFVPSGPETTARDPRILWIMKTNVGPPPDPLGVAFESHPSNPDVAQLAYGGPPDAYREPNKCDQCAGWLVDYLLDAGRPLKPAVIITAGESKGYYSSLIYRARAQLGHRILDTKNSRHPNNAWALSEWVTNPFDGEPQC